MHSTTAKMTKPLGFVARVAVEKTTKLTDAKDTKLRLVALQNQFVKTLNKALCSNPSWCTVEEVEQVQKNRA